jgi:hypothetical protein
MRVEPDRQVKNATIESLNRRFQVPEFLWHHYRISLNAEIPRCRWAWSR